MDDWFAYFGRLGRLAKVAVSIVVKPSGTSRPVSRGVRTMATDSGSPKVRATWLTMLNDELRLIDETEILPIDGDVDFDKETLHGVASLEDRKLYTYAENLEERSARMLVDARYTRDGADAKERLIRKSYEMSLKSGIVRDLLWSNLKDEFDLWAPQLYVGLRKGWIVVSGRREPEEKK